MVYSLTTKTLDSHNMTLELKSADPILVLFELMLNMQVKAFQALIGTKADVTLLKINTYLVPLFHWNNFSIFTCPLRSHSLSKSTYSPSLLYMPRATFVSLPDSSCLNLRCAILSNNFVK